MGSVIEINDTLKISKARGFPESLILEEYLENNDNGRFHLNRVFNFWNADERLYNRAPARVFLVEEMLDGKWLYWGHALVLSQTISSGRTDGRYKMTKLYDPEYQKLVTINESPEGKSYFRINF